MKRTEMGRDERREREDVESVENWRGRVVFREEDMFHHQ